MINRLLAGLLAASMMTTLPVPESAAQEPTAAQKAAHRMNLAGRQRTMSQRMVKAACLVSIDVGGTTPYDQLTQAFELFEQTDVGLRSGNPGLGLEAEKFPKVIEAFDAVDKHWAVLKILVEEEIDSLHVEENELEAMDDASLQVLKFQNVAVFKMGKAYSAELPHEALGLHITVDVAGRQRTLTQKAVKEACLMIAAPHYMEKHADDLAGTVELFDVTLKALEAGDQNVGIVPPPNPEIASKLREVHDLWEPIRRILLKAARDKEPLSKTDMDHVARDSEPLLHAMNEAVELYTKH